MSPVKLPLVYGPHVTCSPAGELQYLIVSVELQNQENKHGRWQENNVDLGASSYVQNDRIANGLLLSQIPRSFQNSERSDSDMSVQMSRMTHSYLFLLLQIRRALKC